MKSCYNRNKPIQYIVVSCSPVKWALKHSNDGAVITT